MAEETPGNLGAMFGGWAAGRAAGNRRLDASVDRLEEQIKRFADAMERLTGALNNTSANVGGSTGAAGPTQAGRRANGGGASFGGQAAGATSHAGGRESYWPTSRGYQGRHSDDSPGLGGHARTYIRENRGSLIAGGAAGAVGLAGVYAMNHTAGTVIGSTLAQQYGSARAGSWNDYYQAGARGNFTAHGDKDHWQTVSLMGQMSGQRMGSTGWNQTRGNIMSMSAVNPMLSNQAGAQASFALGSVGSYNRLAGMGINPMGAGGNGDPRAVARQMLARMNSGNVRTRDQVEAAFATSGSATVTLNAYVQQGLIPAESLPAIQSEMRNILLAQVGGMDYREYNRNAQAANSSGAARERLQNVDIATNTLTQRQRRKEGLERETEAETVRGFVEGMEAATSTLETFRKGLNKILAIPGVGETVGGATGFFNSAGNLLSKLIPGADGPPNMSSASAVYGGAVGASMAMASGPANMASSAVSYAGATAGGGVSGRRVGSTGSGGSRYSLGAVKPWVAKAADVLGSRFGIKTVYGFGQRSNVSDHPKGLALDFMCGKSAGDALAAYAVANHKALNITYIIWRQRIWSVNNKGWKQMEDRGSVTANHFDHVHISFLASPANADLGGLRGGSGGAATGGAASLGAGGSSPDNGTSAAFASSTGGGGSVTGGFSEYAALGLGGGGGGFGGGGPGGSVGASGGGGASVGGGGGGGNLSGGLRISTANIDWTRGKDKKYLEHLASNSDILLIQEANDVNLSKLLPAGWKTNQNMRNAGTQGSAIAWNADKLGDNIGRSGLVHGANQRGNTRHLSYIDTKMNGQQVRLISGHFPLKSRGSQAEFEGNLRELISERPRGSEWLVGTDANQSLARLADRLGGRAQGRGIIGQILSKGLRSGGLSMDRWGVGQGATDHASAGVTVSAGGGVSGNGGSPAQNMSLGRQMAASRGWTGAQWNALRQLWMKESGWRSNADNPTSSAYGIPQALTATHGLGDTYKKNPKAQIEWGLNYIADRYGNPGKAWNFWQKNHWYSAGEWNIRDDVDARVHKGEMIIPSKIADVVRDELTAPGIRDNLGRGRGGSGMQVTFAANSIQVNLQKGTKDEAARAGKWVVDAMMEDQRLKRLAEG